MKAKFSIIAMIFLSIIISACSEDDTVMLEQEKVDLINNTFPEAQAEIQTVLDGIFKSIQENDADKLISYHIYGPKFTEFRDSQYRFGSAENEAYERGLVGAVSGFDYSLDDLRINVFGEVAVVTFHADFRPTIAGEVHQIWGSTTLVFVRVNEEWKITHEHHSPLIVTDDDSH
jgi:ketosteroid isomerase-like protein